MPVEIFDFDSSSLVGNPLGDPPVRRIPVYLPPSYALESERRYPVVFMLHGFTGNSSSWLNVNTFYTPTVPERFEKLIKEGRCGEMILVFVDGYCALGGSQYLNSSATGCYEDYLIADLLPFIDRRYRTLGDAARGLAGKSSGGYGSVRLALRHPELFKAFASHAGDMYFELCYKPDFPKTVMGLQPYLHTPDPLGAFLTSFAEAENKGRLVETLEILAMAACYSPDGSRYDLPFDMATGELRPAVWQRWLEFDPVEMLEKSEYLEALRGMRGAYLDAGFRDEYNLHLGARIFTSHAAAKGIKVHYEEFDGGHMNIDYRYDHSLPFLYQALTA